MKELLAIKIQSHTDLITNSSSELFQLRTDSTVEQVKEALSNITTGYMDPVFFNLKVYRELYDKLDKMFALPIRSDDNITEWYRIARERYKYMDKLIEEHPEYNVYNIVSGWFFDKNDRSDVIYAYRRYLSGDHPHIWREDIQLDDVQTEFDKFMLSTKYKEDWIKTYNIPTDNLIEEYIESHNVPNVEDIWEWSGYQARVEDLDGCIIVVSEDDNSIPYDTWDTINEMFNGTNYHLG